MRQGYFQPKQILSPAWGLKKTRGDMQKGLKHMQHDNNSIRPPAYRSTSGAPTYCTDIYFNSPVGTSDDRASPSIATIPSPVALGLALSDSSQDYRIPRKKLFSLIFFLLATLIAFVKSSLASKALSLSTSPIPAGKSIDCSWSGT